MLHNQILFNNEVASHNSLAFLDVLIEKTDKEIKTSIYRKPSRPGDLTKFSSFYPLRYQRNLVNSLIHRSYTICNSYSQIDIEFRFFKDTLIRNKYLSGFIDQCIRQFLNKSLLLGLAWLKRIPSNIFYLNYLT